MTPEPHSTTLAYLPACPPARLPACPPACPPDRLPARLPACPHSLRYPGPRITCPGSAPVASPSAMTGMPFTSTQRMPTDS
jgi:hypothetical protein